MGKAGLPLDNQSVKYIVLYATYFCPLTWRCARRKPVPALKRYSPMDGEWFGQNENNHNSAARWETEVIPFPQTSGGLYNSAYPTRYVEAGQVKSGEMENL